jgi:hypothetical protein
MVVMEMKDEAKQGQARVPIHKGNTKDQENWIKTKGCTAKWSELKFEDEEHMRTI